MAHSILDWNLNPNTLWFIEIKNAVISTRILVNLYLTQADAEAETNLQASGNVTGGVNVSVTLEPETGVDISYFNDALGYHLRVHGVAGQPSKIFKVNPFVDLPDINNGIYRSAGLIQTKAVSEINKHTHMAIHRNIGIANHVPTMRIGDVCRINSSFRNINVLTTLEDSVIIGTKDALINQIGIVEYTDLNYG